MQKDTMLSGKAGTFKPQSHMNGWLLSSHHMWDSLATPWTLQPSLPPMLTHCGPSNMVTG